MQSKAETVEQYFSEMPVEHREQLSKVRNVILKNLPAGYEEVMNWGMISYQVPMTTYSDTYNGKPLMYAALASNKNNMAVHLMGLYISED